MDHPLRTRLIGEALVRPTLSATAPCTATHEAMIEEGGDGPFAYIVRVCTALGLEAPDPDLQHYVSAVPGGMIKWERHGEFSTYTAIGFLDAEPFQWPEGRPGRRLAACRVRVSATKPPPFKTLAPGDRTEQAVSTISGGRGVLWTTLSLRDDGYVDYSVHDKGLSSERLGRVLRRIFEIETYRVMALIVFPQLREVRGELDRLDGELARAVNRMQGDEAKEGDSIIAYEEETLDILTNAARAVQKLQGSTDFRFAASAAYGRIVLSRLEEIREERVEGFQRLSTFLKRRFTPALDTIEATRRRLERLAARVEGASALLRTRIDLERQRHNQRLLASMDKRADLQARLQQTVEGLSVAAVSYYVFMLVSKLVVSVLGSVPATSHLAEGTALKMIEGGLLVAVLVASYLFLRRVKARVLGADGAGRAADPHL